MLWYLCLCVWLVQSDPGDRESHLGLFVPTPTWQLLLREGRIQAQLSPWAGLARAVPSALGVLQGFQCSCSSVWPEALLSWPTLWPGDSEVPHLPQSLCVCTPGRCHLSQQSAPAGRRGKPTLTSQSTGLEPCVSEPASRETHQGGLGSHHSGWCCPLLSPPHPELPGQVSECLRSVTSAPSPDICVWLFPAQSLWPRGPGNLSCWALSPPPAGHQTPATSCVTQKLLGAVFILYDWTVVGLWLLVPRVAQSPTRSPLSKGHLVDLWDMRGTLVDSSSEAGWTRGRSHFQSQSPCWIAAGSAGASTVACCFSLGLLAFSRPSPVPAE